jgi:hypothetical protein
MTTVRELVFGDEAGEVQAAERLAHDFSISHAVVSKVSEALDFEVSDVLLWAWKTRSSLLDAARETHANPGLVRNVTVKSYSVPWDYELELDVLLNGANTFTIKFVLTIALEVTALAATIQNGLLIGLHPAKFKASAMLEAEGRMLTQRERTFDLRYEITIDNGIPLIPEAVPSNVASNDDQDSEVSRTHPRR